KLIGTLKDVIRHQTAAITATQNELHEIKHNQNNEKLYKESQPAAAGRLPPRGITSNLRKSKTMSELRPYRLLLSAQPLELPYPRHGNLLGLQQPRTELNYRLDSNRPPGPAN
ncbi:hypothetical protein F1880_008380, partial [Penicillium rolfsii]